MGRCDDSAGATACGATLSLCIALLGPFYETGNMHKHHYKLHCVISFALCTLTWYITDVVAIRQQLEFIVDPGNIWTAPFKRLDLNLLEIVWYVPFAVVLLLRSNRYARFVWIGISAYLVFISFDGWNEEHKEVFGDVVMALINMALIVPALATFAVLALLNRGRLRAPQDE